jgi:hypothetical protein
VFTYKKLGLQFIKGDPSGIFDATQPAVAEQVAGIPGLARKELVNASQQPSPMDPYASIRGPLFMVLLVLVTLCLGRFHELLQLKVNPIHAQLDCGWRDAVTVPVNSEQFLKIKCLLQS